MISKEEMKEALRVGDDRTVIEYIEQLENKVREQEDDKQKLIDKLEEYTNNTKKEKLPYFKTVADMIRYKGYAEGRIKACEEILSIVKGENKR